MSDIQLYAELTKVGGGKYRIGVGDPDLWQQLAYFMEVVAMLAQASVDKNPKDINDSESMAQYVSEYITKAMREANPLPQPNNK